MKWQTTVQCSGLLQILKRCQTYVYAALNFPINIRRASVFQNGTIVQRQPFSLPLSAQPEKNVDGFLLTNQLETSGRSHVLTGPSPARLGAELGRTGPHLPDVEQLSCSCWHAGENTPNERVSVLQEKKRKEKRNYILERLFMRLKDLMGADTFCTVSLLQIQFSLF